MNNYHLQIQLLSSSSSSISSSNDLDSLVATEQYQSEHDDALLQSAMYLNQHCEQLLHDSSISSASSSFHNDRYNKVPLHVEVEAEPFVCYTESIHLYQESKNDTNDDDDTHSENNNECSCSCSHFCSCCLPLIAIVIPFDILHYIDNYESQTVSTTANSNHDMNTTTPPRTSATFTSTKSVPMSIILSHVLSKIHPSLSYLQPCGLLRSVPLHHVTQSENNASTIAAAHHISTPTLTTIVEEKEKSERGGETTSKSTSEELRRNSFDILLLKLNHFNDMDEISEEKKHPSLDDEIIKDDEKANIKKQCSNDTSSSYEDDNELEHGNGNTNNNNNLSHRYQHHRQDLERILEEVNGKGMEISPTSIIQALPISNISFHCEHNLNKNMDINDKNGNETGSTLDHNYSNDLKHETKPSNDDNNTCGDADIKEVQSTKKLNQVQYEEYKSSHHEQQQNEKLSNKNQLHQRRQHDENKSQKVLSEIPICPVCRFRIEPQRLGLGMPKPNQRCTNLHNGIIDSCCQNMEFLSPWTQPSYCEACHILQERLRLSGAQPFLHKKRNSIDSSTCTTTLTRSIHQNKLSCFNCGMKETLWVCLSCGVVGCGRYSHGHAKKHFIETSHPFSLELATQRIWDYTTSSFINRDDLLNCTFMQQILGAVNRAAYQQGAASVIFHGDDVMGSSSSCCNNNSDCDNNNNRNFDFYWGDRTTPKKAAVVGEEYEALIQSALEDQAQHFDLEICHLQAQLASEAIDMRKMSSEQMMEVQEIEKEISNLRVEVDVLSREYVDIQAQEAGHHAKSNSLLREQSVTKELLAKIREEAAREHLEGKQMVEDLEQQVSDIFSSAHSLLTILFYQRSGIKML